MAYFNANDMNEIGSSVGNFNRNNNQGNQQRTTRQCTLKPKPKPKKRMFGNEKGGSSTQRLTKRQQVGSVPTPTNPTPPTSRQSYLRNNPPCKKCKYHHWGACQTFHCKRCNKMGYTSRYYKALAPCVTLTHNPEVSPVCHKCGATGHFKRNYPKEMTDEGVYNWTGRDNKKPYRNFCNDKNANTRTPNKQKQDRPNGNNENKTSNDKNANPRTPNNQKQDRPNGNNEKETKNDKNANIRTPNKRKQDRPNGNNENKTSNDKNANTRTPNKQKQDRPNGNKENKTSNDRNMNIKHPVIPNNQYSSNRCNNKESNVIS
ncbi:hypothetical protein Lser_V15G34630 [Lactuca serriola]